MNLHTEMENEVISFKKLVWESWKIALKRAYQILHRTVKLAIQFPHSCRYFLCKQSTLTVFLYHEGQQPFWGSQAAPTSFSLTPQNFPRLMTLWSRFQTHRLCGYCLILLPLRNCASLHRRKAWRERGCVRKAQPPEDFHSFRGSCQNH